MDEPAWFSLGSYAPSGPASTRAGKDRGPGGSLLQEAQRRRELRRAGWPAWRVRAVPVLLPTSALLLVATIVALTQDAAPVALAAVALTAVILTGLWLLLGQSDPGERRLRHQASLERRSAGPLEILTGYGWTVLHDRRLPGGEHRLAHVLVGPGGVVVVTPLPAPRPYRIVNNQLLAAGHVLGPWFKARRWEINTLTEAIAAQLPDAWSCSVAPFAVTPPPPGPAWPWRTVVDALDPAQALTLWDGICIQEPHEVVNTVLSLPAPLPRVAAAQLAAVVEALCPPAGD